MSFSDTLSSLFKTATGEIFGAVQEGVRTGVTSVRTSLLDRFGTWFENTDTGKDIIATYKEHEYFKLIPWAIGILAVVLIFLAVRKK